MCFLNPRWLLCAFSSPVAFAFPVFALMWWLSS
nr:MAG TPA_asm: hypothetical protein [Caudoviricetes sp.]